MFKTIKLFKLALKPFEANSNDFIYEETVNETVKNLSISEKSKNTEFEILMRIKTIAKLIFLTSGAKKVFDQLR